MESLDKVDLVHIDDNGVFKYVLIKVPHTDDNEEEDILNYKIYLRGYISCDYHANVVRKFREEVGNDVPMECIGGGRIEKNNAGKKITVYGYSQEFGQANHSLSAEMLKKKYPDFHVDFSNDGY
ncbi:unnamed protein product [Auanema sp. JU1783]|nr:unnamed protein product [Auanema sp. JU1783]